MLKSSECSSPENDSLESDRELIQAALDGDQRGYDMLASRYQDRLFRSIRSNVGCASLAEDVVQEAFVRAFLHLGSFKSECNFYTWLYRIALNSRRAHFRKSIRTISLDAQGASVVAASRDSPTARMERREACQVVRDALERIETHHRTILILREFDGFDYDTIAQILDIKKGTVRSRLSRARSRLRNELSTFVLTGTVLAPHRSASRRVSSDQDRS